MDLCLSGTFKSWGKEVLYEFRTLLEYLTTSDYNKLKEFNIRKLFSSSSSFGKKTFSATNPICVESVFLGGFYWKQTWEHRFRERLDLGPSGLKRDQVLQPIQVIKETVIFEENLKSTYIKTCTQREAKQNQFLMRIKNSAHNSVHEFLLSVPFFIYI